MRDLGLGHFTFLMLSPTQLVRVARQSGFAFVGLRFHPVMAGAQNWLPDSMGLQELSLVMQGEGIALYDIETIVLDADLAPESLIPAMDATAFLGGKRVNVCADIFPGLSDQFAQICALAHARGLGLDLECMAWRGVNTPQACLNLIARSGAQNAGYLVDTLHHSRCGGTADDISRMKPELIKSAQLCDAPLAAPKGTEALLAEARGGRLLPGEGGLQLSRLIDSLPKSTVISVELPSATDDRPPIDRARAIYNATQKLLEQCTL